MCWRQSTICPRFAHDWPARNTVRSFRTPVALLEFDRVWGLQQHKLDKHLSQQASWPLVEAGAVCELQHIDDEEEGLAFDRLDEHVPNLADLCPHLESGRPLPGPKPRGLQSTR